ncbi:hypothetical protein LTR08_006563 [Meristemomyces frigidus]|nr:hypothetical protein LTR08_006563 [Meristemomyces frigidus]
MYQLPRALRLRHHHHQHPRTFTHIPRDALRLRHHHHPHPRTFTHIPRRALGAFTRRRRERLPSQAVRFTRGPLFTWRRTLTFALYSGAAYAVFRSLGLTLPELEARQKAAVAEGKGVRVVRGPSPPPFPAPAAAVGQKVAEADEWAHKDSTFIPLTWSTELPRSYYKGTDPEWQAFLQIAKDLPRYKRIQEELVATIFASSCKHPVIGSALGKDAKVVKHWLDSTFPAGPPIEYSRGGIEIADETIAWNRQKISGEQQWQLTRALWPRAAGHGFWETGKVLAGIKYRGLKQRLGWEDVDPASPEEKFKLMVLRMEKQKLAKQQRGKKQTSNNLPDAPLVSSETTTAAKPAPASASDSKNPMSTLLDLNLTNPTDLPIALSTFSSALTKHWDPSTGTEPVEPPRGTFVMQGIVEVRGSMGRVMVDVLSYYDVMERKFVSVKATSRVRPWAQKPRG